MEEGKTAQWIRGKGPNKYQLYSLWFEPNGSQTLDPSTLTITPHMRFFLLGEMLYHDKQQ
jgi:hypothetical protein